MWNLVKLELRKGKLSGAMWGAFVAYGIIGGLLVLIYFAEQAEGNQIFVDYNEMLLVIDTFVRITFIIFAAALLARLIISEYRDGTMSQLFTYPVSRRRLIAAKLSIVFVWTFVHIVLANLIIGAIVLVLDSWLGSIGDTLTAETAVRHLLHVVMHALAAAGMSLLPFIIGLRRKSTSQTIISAIVIVAVVCSNNGGFTLSSIIAIPFGLAALGIMLTYLSFRNIDKLDVL